MNTNTTKSLNWTLTKSSIIAVIIGMATYTLFEIISSGEIDINEILTHHLLPTVLIGAISGQSHHMLYPSLSGCCEYIGLMNNYLGLIVGG